MFVLTWISPRHVPPSYIHNTAADEDPCTHRPFPADRCIARTRSAIRGLSVRLCTVRVCRFRIGPHSGGDAQRASSDNTAEHAEHVSSRRSTRSRNDRRTRTRTRGPCTATILLFSARLARLARGNALHGRALRARALRHPLLAPEMAVNRDRSGRPRRRVYSRVAGRALRGCLGASLPAPVFSRLLSGPRESPSLPVCLGRWGTRPSYGAGRAVFSSGRWRLGYAVSQCGGGGKGGRGGAGLCGCCHGRPGARMAGWPALRGKCWRGGICVAVEIRRVRGSGSVTCMCL